MEGVIAVRHIPALLVRNIPVLVQDLSLSGCQVVGDRRLHAAVTGHLCVTLEGQTYRDAVKIVRTLDRPANQPSHTIGGHFAWANQPGSVSIRSVVPAPADED